MNLMFEITDNILKRTDTGSVFNKNKNMYTACFSFETSEDGWDGLNCFAIFTDSWNNSETLYLGKVSSDVLSCNVPNRLLKGTYISVSVYAGDLITTNSVTIPLLSSGYNHHNFFDQKDIFVDIFDRLDVKIDDIKYSDGALQLFSDGELINSVYLGVVNDEVINTRIQEITELLTNKSDTGHSHVTASDSSDGFMSSTDKVKLDTIETGANKTVVDSSLDSESINPVKNNVIKNALDGKSDVGHSHMSSDITDLGDHMSLDICNMLDDLADEISKE